MVGVNNLAIALEHSGTFGDAKRLADRYGRTAARGVEHLVGGLAALQNKAARHSRDMHRVTAIGRMIAKVALDLLGDQWVLHGKDSGTKRVFQRAGPIGFGIRGRRV